MQTVKNAILRACLALYTRRYKRTRAKAIAALRKERLHWKREENQLRHKMARVSRMLPKPAPQPEEQRQDTARANIGGIRRAISNIQFQPTH